MWSYDGGRNSFRLPVGESGAAIDGRCAASTHVVSYVLAVQLGAALLDWIEAAGRNCTVFLLVKVVIALFGWRVAASRMQRVGNV